METLEKVTLESIAKVNKSATEQSLNPIVPFRPVQYLGSKIRVLDDIGNAVQELVPKGGRIADFFAGSTVVSQFIASKGYSIAAFDTQLYAKEFGVACLGIGRNQSERLDSDIVLDGMQIQTLAPNEKLWNEFAQDEKFAIQNSDISKLRSTYAQLPHIWKDAKSEFHSKITNPGGFESAINCLPLICSVYSGSYFGVQQSLEIDQIRKSISRLSQNKLITQWQESAALTSLMFAASRCVHSAGKHFAQPIKNHEFGKNKFADTRLLSDRKISVTNSFREATDSINRLVFSKSDFNNFELRQAEKIQASDIAEFDLVYLDPPYTAQQYSRFYHLLETLCSYKFPNLITDGTITNGLYPKDRFKSVFCSKRNALPAFSTIIERCKSAKANLLISYSHSVGESDGNARTMSFSEILNECEKHYGAKFVEWVGMEHSYRQFNSSGLANQMRNDPEVLITCKIA
jgi:adenine-specific DNA-methyltransferase